MPPLTLTIRCDLHPTPDPQTAHQIGRHIAELAGPDQDAVLAGTATVPDSPTVTWTIGIPADHPGTGFQPVGHHLESLERWTAAAIARHNADTEIRVVELRASTAEQIDRHLDQPAIPDLVGVDEFAEVLGVNRARFYQLRDRPDPGFPGAVRRGVYLRASAERYAQERAERLHRAPRS